MPITNQKLAQQMLSNVPSEIVTPNASEKKYISQIYLANSNISTERYVTLYVYGQEEENLICPKLRIPPEGYVRFLINEDIIPLNSEGESLYAKCDKSDEVSITVVGTVETK